LKNSEAFSTHFKQKLYHFEEYAQHSLKDLTDAAHS